MQVMNRVSSINRLNVSQKQTKTLLIRAVDFIRVQNDANGETLNQKQTSLTEEEWRSDGKSDGGFGRKVDLDFGRSSDRHRNSDRQLTCACCEAVFRQRGTLNRHVKTVHDKTREFTCGECGKAFGRMTHLR